MSGPEWREEMESRNRSGGLRLVLQGQRQHELVVILPPLLKMLLQHVAAGLQAGIAVAGRQFRLAQAAVERRDFLHGIGTDPALYRVVAGDTAVAVAAGRE